MWRTHSLVVYNNSYLYPQAMDFVEGLPPSSGSNTLWLIVDQLTKYAHFVTISHPYTKVVAQLFLKYVFKLHEMPSSIISYKDPTFTSKF